MKKEYYIIFSNEKLEPYNLSFKKKDMKSKY